jgi:hypothetical protein
MRWRKGAGKPSARRLAIAACRRRAERARGADVGLSHGLTFLVIMAQHRIRKKNTLASPCGRPRLLLPQSSSRPTAARSCRARAVRPALRGAETRCLHLRTAAGWRRPRTIELAKSSHRVIVAGCPPNSCLGTHVLLCSVCSVSLLSGRQHRDRGERLTV